MNISNDFDSVDNLKKKLISRNISVQIAAVDFVYKKLTDNESKADFVEYILKNDISIYLGEASATTQSALMKNIIQCFKIISEEPKFFKNSCAPYIVSCLIRATHLYISNDCQESAIQNIMCFLSDIFLKVNCLNEMSLILTENSFDVLQIFNLLQIIIDKKDISHMTLLVACKTLHSTIVAIVNMNLSDKVLRRAIIVLEYFLTNVLKMYFRNDFENCVYDYRSCILGLICHLCIDSIKINDIDKENKFNQDRRILLNTVKDTITLIIEKIKLYNDLIDVICYKYFLKLINLCFQHTEIQNVIPDFTELLVNNEFIIFLPALREKSSNQDFKKLCQTTLAELLIRLSLQKFNFSQWNGGESNFRSHLYEGLLENEYCFNNWLQILNDNNASESEIYSLLIYLYFYYSSSISFQKDEQACLPHIVNYIQNIPNNIVYPLPILKCLWLIFTVSINAQHNVANFSGANIDDIRGEKLTIETINCKLSNLISTNVKELYTHHSSIIYWVFSSARIPIAIQNTVLQLWLEKEKHLPEEILSISGVWWSLVEVIQGFSENVCTACDILKYCLTNVCDKNNADEIRSALWKSLPDIITLYLENDLKYDIMLKFVFQLCGSEIPPSISLNIISKCIFLLSERIDLFNLKDDDLCYYILRLILNLLNIALEYGNTVVLSRLMSSKSFTAYTFLAISKQHTKLSTIAYKIFSFGTNNLGFYGLEPNKTFTVDLPMLIDSLEFESEEEKSLSLLQFIYVLFQTKNEHPTLKLLIAVDLNLPSKKLQNCFRTLFFKLSMLCCKETENHRESAWRCLRSVLLFSKSIQNGNITRAICEQPWTRMLVQYYFSQNDNSKSELDDFFLDFLHEWLIEAKRTADESGYALREDVVAYSIVSMTIRNLDREARDRQSDENQIKIDNVLAIANSIL